MLPQLIGIKCNVRVVLRQIESCHQNSNDQNRQQYNRPG